MKSQTKQKIAFNGGTILSALEDSKISPENFFGKYIPTIKELKEKMKIEAEIEAFCLMNPMKLEVVGAQSIKLVRNQWGDSRN